MMRAFDALGRFLRPDFPSSHASWPPLGIAVIWFLSAVYSYCVAQGLWKLKNWSRVLTLVLTTWELIVVSMPSAIGPIKLVIPGDPFTLLAGRVLSFVVVLYLMNAQVRAAFGETRSRQKWLVPAVSALALFSLVYDLSRSGPEFRAIRWHMRHGDRITVSGVSFPIYSWYVPGQEPDGTNLHITDIPGPFRPNDRSTYITVKGVNEAGNTLTIEQRVDRKLQEYEKAGYKDLSKFSLDVGKQTLGCVRESFLGDAIYCYGDGPIASIFFTGGDRSLARFKHMMAEARLDLPK